MLETDDDNHLSILFTDVEGSTRRWETEKEKMSASLALHDQIIRNIVGSNGGLVFSIAGDSFGVIFSQLHEALAAAQRIQTEIQATDWSDGVVIRVRMSVHSGPVIQRDNGAYGPEIIRAAILCEIGHAGQILLSKEAVQKLPEQQNEYLGRYRLRKISEPQHVYQLGKQAFAPLRNVTTKVCTVPAIRSSLIGRQQQVRQLLKLIDSTRLLTLVGPGGVGKTMLAFDLALRLYDGDFDGVHLIELDTVADPAEITSAIARGLELTLLNDTDPVSQLLDYLANRNSLLLFDNCEHLLGETADLIDVLLSRCATLKVIATSREVLDVAGESVWRVPSLPAATAATELFLRAANNTVGVVLDTPLNRVVIGEICELLDGLPLAIELAAARTRMLSIEQIGTMLRDQLQALKLQGRQRKRRKETLADVVKWSHDLLDTEEREAFRRLTIFSGGFTLGDAHAIIDCDETEAWDLVESLVAKSLIDTRPDADGSPRFNLLNTIRAYGTGQLHASDEYQSTAQRHCEYFVKLAERARHPYLPDPKTVLRHQAELLNLRAAAQWASDNSQPVLAARIASGCVIEFDRQGEFASGIKWARGVYGNTDEHAFNALVTESFLRGQEGNIDHESALAREAVALAGDNQYLLLPVAICLASLADIFRNPEQAVKQVADAYRAVASGPQPQFNKAFIDIHAALLDLLDDRPQQLLARLEGYHGGMITYGRTCALVQMGNTSAAQQLVDKTAGHPADAWLHFNDLAQVLCSLDIADTAHAADVLVKAASRDSGLRRWQDGDFLVHFAALHNVSGNADRAAHLIDNCRSRHGLISAIAVGIKQQLSNWPRQYNNAKTLQWLTSHYSVESTERILAVQPGLLTEEVEYWRSRATKSSTATGSGSAG